MIVTCVHIHVKPECLEAFKEITLYNHEHTRKEAGNLRFDVLENAKEANRFVLYEVFESREAANEHKKTEHYAKWRDTVAEMMASPREGVAYHALAPLDQASW